MKNRYCILQKKEGSLVKDYSTSVVVVYLYYLDKIEFCLKYLKNIPEKVDVYIITSNVILKELLEKNCCEFKNIKEIRIKQNRGRDISAMLISAKDIFINYKYVCFIHDKMSKNKDMISDTEKWEKNMFENMLGSENYINNILNYMKNNKEVGLMIPPAPYSKNISRWYTNSWLKNYNNTVKLLEMLGCNNVIEYKDYPLAIGTAFWCRSEALKKLYEHNWKYEDFDDEPLKMDGTISHAIERALPYVADDSGYITKVVMNNVWAECFLEEIQDDMIRTFDILSDEYGIRSLTELRNYPKREKEILEFVGKSKEVYIYGAGDRAKDCVKYLQKLNIHIKGYIVTEKSNEPDWIEFRKLYSVSSVKNKNISIIIAVGINYQHDILHILKENKFRKIYLF